MEISGGSDVRTVGDTLDARSERTLAAAVAARIERLMGLFRSLSPPSGLSLTAAATLATLERSGPSRLTSLAVKEGVTQPAMTQLVGRMDREGLVVRLIDPEDGRGTLVAAGGEGVLLLAGQPVGQPVAFLGEHSHGLMGELVIEGVVLHRVDQGGLAVLEARPRPGEQVRRVGH